MRRLTSALCAVGAAALAIALTDVKVHAWACDFLTGGGFIYVDGAKGTFAIGGGCKKNVPDQHGPYWGHLEYHDHGNGLNAHWQTITAYHEWESSTDDKGRLMGQRLICGTARTNLYGDVDFAVVVRDAGEPGVNDEFDIQLMLPDGTVEYTTFGSDSTGSYPHKLGGGDGGGGNIQLHKPNPSNVGEFGGDCPALFG
jgi:hypothetical protein